MSGSYMPKYLRGIWKSLRDQGWGWEWTRNNHIKFMSPDGGLVFTSGTLSDKRGKKNLISQLRRHGAEV